MNYIILYRPAGYATLPAGVKWDYVEAPMDVAARRPDLPLSKHRHGIISTSRALTEEELRAFQLMPAP